MTHHLIPVAFSMVFCFTSFGQERMIPHLTRPDGGFSNKVVISNAGQGSQMYELEAFSEAGTSMGRFNGSIDHGESRIHTPLELFGTSDVSHFLISGASKVEMTVIYEKTGFSTAHVQESSIQATQFKFYPGNPNLTWDGIAYVNMGTDVATVQVNHMADDGRVIESVETSTNLSPKAKELVVLGFNPQEGSSYEIISNQPLSVTGLRGTHNSNALWENELITSPTVVNRRILPHVTRHEGLFTTQIILANTSDSDQSYNCIGYNESGEKVATLQDVVIARSTPSYTIEELFRRTDISHVMFTKNSKLMVSAAYQLKNGPTGPAHVHETSIQGKTWRLFPGNPELSWDGFAAVNMGSWDADIYVKHWRSDGQLIESKRVINGLHPLAKGLYLFDFEIQEGSYFEVTSEQNLAFMALRGSSSSEYLWENKPILLHDPISLRFDFQPAQANLEPGFIPITSADTYDTEKGYGLLSTSGREVDGSGFTWQVFSRSVTLEQAIPSAVLSDATRDCILTGRGGTLQFKADVPVGVYDVTLWLGDVTRPTHQVRAEVNGAIVDVPRMDINIARGNLWTEDRFFGNAVPRTIRVDASNGSIECTLGMHPEGAQPIQWTYVQDEDPKNPPYERTVTIVPAFATAGIQAIVITPASDPALVSSIDGLALGSTQEFPELVQALDAFNQSQVDIAQTLFEQMSDETYAAVKAAGLFSIAGHPASTDNEIGLLQKSISLLGTLLSENPNDHANDQLMLQLRLAQNAEFYRSQYGYAINAQSASENMGRSCSLMEQLQPGHPYYWKGRILYLRNRGGLDPRRVSPSWELAQLMARQMDDAWGLVNPYVHLYATDEWANIGQPWTVNNWSELAGEGPDWARSLMSNVNTWIDLFEWWGIHRQSMEGDIGGGWTDDVEIVPAFGLMALALKGASDILDQSVLTFADGIWNSNIIDRERGFQVQYGDVEHTAEPTGNILHMTPLIRLGDPEGIERLLKSAHTFAEFFLADESDSPEGHRHFKGNYMSSTQIALAQNSPDHRTDIPLNGRVTAPFSFLVWYSSNPGIEVPYRQWIESWVEDAERTDKGKPAGVFPHAVWRAPGNDEIGYPGTNDWWSKRTAFGQLTDFPNYHFYLYNQAGFFHLVTKDDSFRSVHDATSQYAMSWLNAGSPDVNPTPTGMEELWVGSKLRSAAAGAILNLKIGTGLSDWDTYLENFGTSYGRFLLDPTDLSSIEGLSEIPDEMNASWPYRTTEGIMTDRILIPGWADAISYYIGADVFSVFFGMPNFAATWENTSRLFAATVTQGSSSEFSATAYLFSDEAREVKLHLWTLDTGGDYVLQVGPSMGPGTDPTEIDQTIPFSFNHRGEAVAFTMPPRQTISIQVRQAVMNNAKINTDVLPIDLGIAARDITYDSNTKKLSVRIHNLGSSDANQILIHLNHEEKVISSQVIDQITAPVDLVPKSVGLLFDLDQEMNPDLNPVHISVTIDPNTEIQEITKENNVAFTVLGSDQVDPKPPMITAITHGETTNTRLILGKNFLDGSILLQRESAEHNLSLTFLNEGALLLTIPPDLNLETLLLSIESPFPG